MKSTISLIGALLVVAATTPLFAGQFYGNIHITAHGSVVAVNPVANSVAFSPTAPGAPNAEVSWVNGNYSSIPIDTSVNYFDFNYTLPFAEMKIWELTNDLATSFTLKTITTVVEDIDENLAFTGLFVEGHGMASLNGFDDTYGRWTFSADGTNPATFSFSSTLNVPDGSTTATLMGLAMMALAIIPRRRF